MLLADRILGLHLGGSFGFRGRLTCARCGGLWRPFRVFVHERRWLLARYRLPSFRQRMPGHNSSPSPCDNNDAEREVRVIRVGWLVPEYFSYSNFRESNANQR